MTVNQKSLEIDQKAPLASPSYHDESCRGVEEDTSDSPRRLSCSSPLPRLSRVKVDHFLCIEPSGVEF